MSSFTARRSSVVAAGFALVLTASSFAHAAELKVFFSGGLEGQADAIVSAYRKVRGGTRVTSITTGPTRDFTLAVEKKPDVYVGLFAEMSNYADIGLFEDVAKLLSPKVINEFPRSFTDAFAVGKRLLGLPVAGYTTGLHYNPELFTKAGLGRPDATWTWNGKFLQAARKLTSDTNGDGIPEVYGAAGMTCNQFGQQGMPNPHYLSMVYGYGGNIVDSNFKKVMYTEKPAMEAINLILQLHQDKLADMTDYTYDSTDSAEWPLLGGKTAMMPLLCASKNLPFVYQKWGQGKAPKFKTALSVIPKGPKGTVPANMTQVASIMCTSKNKKEAVEFLGWLASEKGQSAIMQTVGALPTTHKGLKLKKANELLDSQMLKAYANGRTWSARKGYLDIEFSLWNDIRSIAMGESTMAELIENAKTRGPQIIANSTYSWQ